jgi:hypothetical protein
MPDLAQSENAMSLKTRVKTGFKLRRGRAPRFGGPGTPAPDWQNRKARHFGFLPPKFRQQGLCAINQLRVPRLLRLLLLHGRHALLVPPRQVRCDAQHPFHQH